MTTNEINTTRLDLHNGEKATLLVAATRWRLLAQEQQRQRIVAIGRCVNGGAFKVTAPIAPPADFAEAVAEVDSRQHSVRLSDEALAEIENEHVGAEIGRRPFEW